MNLANLALRIDIEVIPDHFNQKQNLPKSSNIMIQDTLSSGGILLLSNQQVCLDTLKKTSSTTELLGAAITANPTVDEVHQWHLPKTTEIEIHTHTHTYPGSSTARPWQGIFAMWMLQERLETRKNLWGIHEFLARPAPPPKFCAHGASTKTNDRNQENHRHEMPWACPNGAVKGPKPQTPYVEIDTKGSCRIIISSNVGSGSFFGVGKHSLAIGSPFMHLSVSARGSEPHGPLLPFRSDVNRGLGNHGFFGMICRPLASKIMRIWVISPESLTTGLWH